MWRNSPKEQESSPSVQRKRRAGNREEGGKKKIGNLSCRPTSFFATQGSLCTGAHFTFCHQADNKHLYLSFLFPRIAYIHTLLRRVYSFRSIQSYCAHQDRHPPNRPFLGCGDQTVRTGYQPCRRPRSLHSSSLSFLVLHWPSTSVQLPIPFLVRY